MTVTVLVAYRPKPGAIHAGTLLQLLREHVPLLRREGLATGLPAVVLRAHDGTLVELFEWHSAAAIEAAHHNPAVQALWNRFAAVCDYVPLNQLPEAAQLFAEFERLDL